jgi:methionyl-tRNA formyltransferase
MARIAFFGTPDFAKPALLKLWQFCKAHGHELVLVVTQPDTKQGRNQHVSFPPVKQLAVELHLPVAQPQSLRKNTPDGAVFYDQLKALNLDLVVVVAYGKIITQRLLDLPTRGFVNIHGSLLPRLRGAAPIQRSIMLGFKETGVCLMDMVLGLDEGDVWAERKTPILASDTSATLSARLSAIGASLLLEHLPKLLSGGLTRSVQGEGHDYARMLSKEEGQLSFHKPGAVLSCEVRGLDPWPASFAVIDGRRVKFFDSFFVPLPKTGDTPWLVSPDCPPGTVVSMKPFLGVRVVDGVIYFQSLQVEGRKKLRAFEALQGLKLAVGEQLLGD